MRLTKNLLPKIAVLYIFLGVFTAIFAYILAPDNSIDANTMHITMSNKSPGYSTYLLQKHTIQQQQNLWSKWFKGKAVFKEETPIKDDFKIINNVFHYQKPLQQEWFQAPQTDQTKITKKTFILGTDKYGRDLLSRLIIGSRISFSIGFVAVLISLIIGISLGALAGYFQGWVDHIIMWLINVTWSVPTILLVIAITVSLGKGLWQIYIAVSLTMWVEVARVVRGQVMSMKSKPYIEAAKVLGLPNYRIIIKHILPNIIGPIIVISAANFAAAILVESGLSFLGLGAQPPTPTWGIIIKNHYNYIITGKAYLSLLPGALIVLTVLSFMILSHAARDWFDEYIKN